MTYPAGHYLADQLIPLGFDALGYNYQAHSFKGYHANAFAKFVAVALDASEVDGVWYDATGTEIGAEIWDSFAIVQEIINDPSTGGTWQTPRQLCRTRIGQVQAIVRKWMQRARGPSVPLQEQ